MSNIHKKSTASTEARAALAELTAHLLRVAVGDGNGEHMICALDRLQRAMELLGASAKDFEYEANGALSFTVRPADSPDPIEDAFDQALAGALGIVASRLEASRSKELISLSHFFDSMRVLEDAGEWDPVQGVQDKSRSKVLRVVREQ